MNNNKGFTLVELLAVIVILALIITIAVPAVTNIMSKTQNNAYCTRVSTFESSAKLWGKDHYDEISEGKCVIEEDGNCYIRIIDLVNSGYIKKDNKDATKEEDYVVDERDNTTLINQRIKVFIKDKRVYATYQHKSSDDKNLCKKK